MIKNFEKILQENHIISQEIHQIREKIEQERKKEGWSFEEETIIWSKRNKNFLSRYGYKLVPWRVKGEGVSRLQKI